MNTNPTSAGIKGWLVCNGEKWQPCFRPVFLREDCLKVNPLAQELECVALGFDVNSVFL